jgi:hypothetical protein
VIDWRLSPCPSPVKGSLCQVCGGAYVCLESRRPKKHELAAREAAVKAKRVKRTGPAHAQ